MWKILIEVIGRSSSIKTVMNELIGPNGTAKEMVDIAITLNDF